MKRDLTNKQKVALERGNVLYRLKGVKDLGRYSFDNIKIFTESEKDILYIINAGITELEHKWGINNSIIMQDITNE